MSFLWGASPGQSEFEVLLEKTTSDALPSSTPPDLVASLQLADLIRSTAVPPTAASKSLFRRLKHTNPNVQLLALSVLDICVKNGGTPFLHSVASKEFAGDLEALARGTVGSNRDVKETVTAKLQDWATAFAGKESLRHSDLVRSYERMKNDGFPFPARDPSATAAMVDSLSAPDWKDAAYCTRCRTDFTTFNRKHHCRNCGDVFDQQCSANTAPLPHFGITEEVRVCDGCIKKIKEGKSGALARSTSLGAAQRSGRPGLPERSSTVSHGTSSNNKRSAARAKEEDDLQRAIAASLLEANPSSSSGPAFELRKNPPAKSGYHPSYSIPVSKTAAPGATAEEEDPDLAAAIAASLRDVAPAPSAPSFDASSAPAATYAQLYPTSNSNAYPSLSTHNTTSNVTRPRYAPLPSYDLSPTESSTLHSFTSILAQPPPHLGHRERQLYEQATLAAPRLERGLEDADRRKKILVEMNQKLAEAASMYQGALEKAAQAAYHQQAQPQFLPQQQSTYAQYASPSAPTQFVSNPQYAYQPAPIGQPLPYAVSSPPPPQAQVQAQAQAQPTPQPQAQVQPQPAGYYKPSQFPRVPSGPQAVLFPHVPQERPWDERPPVKQQEEQQQLNVGELIEL